MHHISNGDCHRVGWAESVGRGNNTKSLRQRQDPVLSQTTAES